MNSHFLPKILFSALLLLCAPFLFAQTVSGTLIDKTSDEGIPFATVQLGENYGVITNEEGNFSINTENFTENDSLVFSSLGYKSQRIALKDFKTDTLYLAKNVEELGQVLLLNKNLSAEEIMAKVNENLSKNYDNSLTKSTVFHRQKVGNKFYDMGFEIKKAEFIDKKVRKAFNHSVDSLLSGLKGETSRSFFSDLSTVLVGPNDSLLKDSLKVRVVKATHLINEEKSLSTDKLQEKVMKTLLEKLKTSNTFKLKTSIITLEDSLDLSEIEMDEDKVDSLKPAHIRNQMRWALKKTGDKESFDFISDYKDYDFTIEKVSMFNDEPIYVLSFVRATGLFSGNGRYAGTLYISADSFAILKMIYHFADGEHGTKVNLKFLLGVKFEEKENSGTLIFQKNANGKYSPKYIQTSQKGYGYFSRKFVLKENDKRKDRMKMKFDFTIEMDFTENEEWVFLNTEPLTKNEFQNFKENDGVVEEKIEKYDPKIWEKYNVLAPTKAIREYTH
ncbi:MAG TPA: carboxypeptidase-like regulatory domain-containing protein [Flavobacteriaceae bacterium]|nr:carboxypeptidase-like regulatory domain-containing protein [Flavobacteriaceae bacterium]